MKNKFFKYCEEVAKWLTDSCTFNGTRAVIEDIEAVARCFDAKMYSVDCAQKLIDRKNSLPRN